MAAPKFIRSQVNQFNNPAPTPPWFALGAIIAVVVFTLWVIFSGIFSSDDPDIIAASVGPPQAPVSIDIETGDAVAPDAAGQDNQPGQPQPAAPDTGAGDVTADQQTIEDPNAPGVQVADGQPRVISRKASVFTAPLTDDGNTVQVPSFEGTSVVPRNVLATAHAAFWSTVDAQVAQSVPLAPGVDRQNPQATNQLASLTAVNLDSFTPNSYTFTAAVDADGPATSAPRQVTVTILSTPQGYVVGELS